MGFLLKGKNALVCGSSKGIGKAMAIALADLGASITLVARNEDKLIATKEELNTNVDQKHNILLCDFSNPSELKKIIQEHLKNYSYQILINNTGGPPAGNILDAKEEQFIVAFQNHLLCNHILSMALIPGMKQSGYGRIINVISTSVKIPIRGLGVSNTIRAAVANWSKTLSIELAPFGITVNNILPGATKTERLEEIIYNRASSFKVEAEKIEEEMLAEIPMGRFAVPAEVAAAAAFLASPLASYITGINIPVDGGRTGSL